MKNRRALSYLAMLVIFTAAIFFYFFYIHKGNKEREAKEQEEKITSWDTRLEHARMLSYLKKYDEAKKEYKALLKIDPASNKVKSELAKIYYYEGNYGKALKLLKHNQNEENNLLIANILILLKDYSAAENILNEYLQKNPSDRKALLNLAKVLSWQGKYDSALAIYQKLLTEDPDNVQLRRHYALVLLWKGEFNSGAEELQKTLK